jgi:hypothetical protein
MFSEFISEVGSTNFYYSPLNANPLIFLVSPLSANPLIFQMCLSANPPTYIYLYFYSLV